MVKIGDRVQIYETCSDYYGRCGIVTDDDFCPTSPYKVEFEDGDHCIFEGKDLIVVSTEEEKVMKFKVGDKVTVVDNQLGNKGKVGEITKISGLAIPYYVSFGMGNGQWSNASDLELVTEEEKVMKFKVGDKVKVKDSWFGYDGQVGVVLDIDNYGPRNYNIKFDTEVDNVRRDEKFMVGSLELVTEEEETSMEFKVGDKVKVKDSWFGFTGVVGLIVRIDDTTKHPYRVKFDVVDEELFAEGSLELVKEKAEKQSFTKSDLKTGMGVVLRDGSKGHVLLGTEAGDVIRFINGGSNQWSSVDEYDENMIDCDISAMDIVEVYSSRYAYTCLTDRVFNQDCVFKREEPKPTKMTMKEIDEHFGKPIEIVE